MAENDFKEALCPVKPELKPILVRGAMYTQGQLIEILEVSDKTLRKWEALGLTALQPGTKQKFFLSDDVIDLFVRLAKTRKGKPK